MRELVQVLAKWLVDSPDQVTVVEVEGPDYETVYEVRVAPEDVGKIIGKQGRIIKAIRNVVKAAAVKDGRRVSVEIVD